MSGRDILALVLVVLGVLVAAGSGGLSAADTSDAYAALEQPSWAPPGWLFGPVWTVLYVSIAWVGWAIWRAGGWSRDMQLWSAQLAVNAVWTPLFFALELRGLALVWIILLLGLVLWLVKRTWRMPGLVLLPYALWVAFAACLNGAVWWLNR